MRDVPRCHARSRGGAAAVVVHLRLGLLPCQRRQVAFQPAGVAGCIDVIEVVIPSAGLDAGQQYVPGLWRGEAPDAKETVCAGLVDGIIRIAQGQHFNSHLRQSGHGGSDACQECCALAFRQGLPGGVGCVEFDEVVWHG